MFLALACFKTLGPVKRSGKEWCRLRVAKGKVSNYKVKTETVFKKSTFLSEKPKAYQYEYFFKS